MGRTVPGVRRVGFDHRLHRWRRAARHAARGHAAGTVGAGPPDRHDQRRAGPVPADRRRRTRPGAGRRPGTRRRRPARRRARGRQVHAAARRGPAVGGRLGHLDAVKPGLLVVDSVQTITAPGTDGVPGGVTQVRAVTAALVTVAKERGVATVLVGHVTKDGQVAGPRVLEHLVDVVLQFEGDRHSALRLVRGLKNRFGAADEVGCFEMHEGGIAGLADPSGLFLTRYAEPTPGTCVTVAMEGRRALVTEVQALIGAQVAGSPRRTVSGLDSARLAMVLAVLQRRTNVRLTDREVFAATVGGIRVVEPAADLGMALAVASATHDLPLAADLVAIGEVGLTGEVRRVGAVPRRLAEAARLGFRHALVPPGSAATAPAGMRVQEVGDVRAAVQCAARASADTPSRSRPDTPSRTGPDTPDRHEFTGDP